MLREPVNEPFRSVLVIGVAGTYETRAKFERDMVAALSSDETTVTAYYTVLGRHPQFSRANIQNAVRARRFDAVILSRQKGQEQEDLAPGRPTGTAFDLFGYDYAELNRDLAIRDAAAVTFVSEMYDATTERKIWSIETLSQGAQVPDGLIVEQVAAISDVIRRDGLVGR